MRSCGIFAICATAIVQKVKIAWEPPGSRIPSMLFSVLYLQFELLRVVQYANICHGKFMTCVAVPTSDQPGSMTPSYLSPLAYHRYLPIEGAGALIGAKGANKEEYGRFGG